MDEALKCRWGSGVIVGGGAMCYNLTCRSGVIGGNKAEVR